MAQNIGMLRGESDDNRRCCLALTFAEVGGEESDLSWRDLSHGRKSLRHDCKEDFLVLKSTKVLEEVEWDCMDGAVDARGSKLDDFEEVLIEFVFLVKEVCQFVEEGRVKFSRGELICCEGYCASLVCRGCEGKGCTTPQGGEALCDKHRESPREQARVGEGSGCLACGEEVALRCREWLRLFWGGVTNGGCAVSCCHSSEGGARQALIGGA